MLRSLLILPPNDQKCEGEKDLWIPHLGGKLTNAQSQ
jgi:hypothetical protein